MLPTGGIMTLLQRTALAALSLLMGAVPALETQEPRRPFPTPQERKLDKAVRGCEDAEDVAACLRERLEKQNKVPEDPYPTIPASPQGSKRVTVTSAEVGLALATRLRGTRIQISHKGQGESVVVGPFETLTVPLSKLKEVLLPAAERTCAGAENPTACLEEYLDRFKTERYAERFSFIRWAERLGREPQLINDPFEAVDIPGYRVTLQVNNLHAIVGETGFAARFVAHQATPRATFEPALYLYFEFVSPHPTIAPSVTFEEKSPTRWKRRSLRSSGRRRSGTSSPMSS